MGKLYKIAGPGGSSGLNSCPTVIGEVGDDVNVIVQGYILDSETLDELGIPAGETAARIPRSILLAAAGKLAEG
jgi:hypothetical protein